MIQERVSEELQGIFPYHKINEKQNRLSRIKENQEVLLIARFIIVGGLCSVVYYVIYSALLFCSVQYQLAGCIGYVSGTISSYFLNKKWTFKSGNTHSLKQVSLFVLNYVTALSVNLGVLTLLVSEFHINKFISAIFAIGFSAIASYLGNRFIVFK